MSRRPISRVPDPLRRHSFPHGFAYLLAAAVATAALGCQDDAGSPNAPDPVPAPALGATSAAVLAFRQVSAGDGHTCGVTTTNQAYCWGSNAAGQLGDGTITQRVRPVAVAGGLPFNRLSAGQFHTCGVTTDFKAYCWGEGGALGDGTTTERHIPVRVVGGRRFRQVDAGVHHTCGVSYPDNRGYCWGDNAFGQLGDGTTTPRLAPTPVAGGLEFQQVATGFLHSCGVTTTGRVFCWGSNQYGQIGDGSNADRRLKPSRIDNGRRFHRVDAGWTHSCAVTTDDLAFCWGDGRFGAIGDGRTVLRFSPRAVAGGLSFDRVTTGTDYACAETPSNVPYCWGSNNFGQFGNGTIERSLKPTVAEGGRKFSQVSAGNFHVCGVTPAAAAYCSGSNDSGQLGNGESGVGLESHTPVAVIGP